MERIIRRLGQSNLTSRQRPQVFGDSSTSIDSVSWKMTGVRSVIVLEPWISLRWNRCGVSRSKALSFEPKFCVRLITTWDGNA